MTDQLYLNDTYLFESDARIVEYKKDERDMSYILLNQTIFYPQGGGQPCDHGKIICGDFEYAVRDVKQIGDEIRHYIEPFKNLMQNPSENSSVKCFIAKNRRLLNARYHTAGHLLGNIVKELHPNLKAQKCHAFPGEAYIEFCGDEVPNEQLLSEKLQNAIEKNSPTKIFETDRRQFESIYYKLPYEIPESKKFRVMQIGNYPPIPCGGTHIKSTGEIGEMTLKKMKQKNGLLKISFGVV
ncbi:MAG: alanyl-tRNA editing protein [Holosporaceae bacterium]|jgi:alanyl-tRNA synthetase|nr:alanyl-tRNA editing protein [Holosporaceae bacterium]